MGQMGLVGMEHIYNRKTIGTQNTFTPRINLNTSFSSPVHTWSIGSSESKKVQFHKLVRSIANNFGRK